MNDELTDEQSPAQPDSPAVLVKNKGGRPPKNKIATSLAEVVAMMESLSRSEAPNATRQRLLDRQFEFYTMQQQREDAQKNDKTAAENRELREQIVALRKENADLRTRPEPQIDFDEMLARSASVPTTQTDHSACIPKSAHDATIQGLPRQIEQLEKDHGALTDAIELVKDIAEERLKTLLAASRCWAMNDQNAKSILNLEKEYDALRGKLGRPPLYQPDPPSKEKQEYLEKLNRDTQEWHRRSAELNRESVL